MVVEIRYQPNEGAAEELRSENGNAEGDVADKVVLSVFHVRVAFDVVFGLGLAHSRRQREPVPAGDVAASLGSVLRHEEATFGMLVVLAVPCAKKLHGVNGAAHDHKLVFAWLLSHLVPVVFIIVVFVFITLLIVRLV